MEWDCEVPKGGNFKTERTFCADESLGNYFPFETSPLKVPASHLRGSLGN